MSKYINLLDKLRREIKTIESIKHKKRWKPYQKIMIDYINGATKKAVFEKDGHKIILSEGDEKKGFMHILLRHYKTNDLEAMDIVNIFEIYFRGIKLAEEGVSNNHFTVYMKLANQKEFRLVLNPINENSWIITAYRKN
ncbi:MAG: hypothetical protein IE890_05425 [Arcobacter sp.]|nr:hypothetical protein [Arcobacter sp.]